MASVIENYGYLSNLNGSALVSRDGSIDWLCLPRFDSDACMAALLGRDEHGCWAIYPSAEVRRVQRRYRAGTLILVSLNLRLSVRFGYGGYRPWIIRNDGQVTMTVAPDSLALRTPAEPPRKCGWAQTTP